jgi:hypothetical protein
MPHIPGLSIDIASETPAPMKMTPMTKTDRFQASVNLNLKMWWIKNYSIIKKQS